jgi:serine phosphatase RsbU (regulator of sigma subunit)
LFSDGVFEFDTTTGQRWSLEDFLPSLTETTIHGLGEPQRIYQSVQRVARRGPLEDDFTVLVARFV